MGLDPIFPSPRVINLESLDPEGIDEFPEVHELPEGTGRMLGICAFGRWFSFISFSKKLKTPQKLSLGNVVECDWKSSEI